MTTAFSTPCSIPLSPTTKVIAPRSTQQLRSRPSRRRRRCRLVCYTPNEEEAETIARKKLQNLAECSSGDSRKATSEGQVVSKFWDWKDHGKLHYLYSESSSLNSSDEQTSSSLINVVFLPGFGAPAEHYKDVMDLDIDARLYALDFLGQGRSEPLKGVEDSLSVELWKDQVIEFLQNVVGGPAYIVGNSVGGLIAGGVASDRGFGHNLVKGCIMLNPTPFFSVVPHPKLSPNLHNWTKPLQSLARNRLLSKFWKNLTEEKVVSNTLKFIFASKEKVTEEFVSSILEPTRQPHAKAAFMSLLLSPGLEDDFEACLEEAFVKRDVPLCLIYGKEDPWVGPLWGARLKQKVPSCQHYEISPSGHCPHVEGSPAIKLITSRFIRGHEGDCSERAEVEDIEYVDGIEIKRKHGAPATFWEKMATGSMLMTFLIASLATLANFSEIGALLPPG